MGVKTRSTRLLVIFASTLITSASVAVAGIVGWIGLVIPHLARAIVGPNYKVLLPCSMVVGAVYLLLVDNQLFGTEKSMETALEKLAQESQERGGEFISIFYGEGVQQGEAEQALAQFEAACPEAEITLLEGGQPVYHYLISVE